MTVKLNHDVIKLAVINAKATVKAIASRAGLNPHTLSQAMTKDKTFSLKTVGKIADALNLPPKDLIA